MKNSAIKVFAILLLSALIGNISCTNIGNSSSTNDKSADYPPFPADHAEKLEWWKDARFGMFIHWNPSSLKGTEIGWSRGRVIPVEEYDSLYLQFNPVNFNPAEWVKLAKDAGMKYIVFTARHHDGFCMWDTKYTDYNIMNSAYGRDIVAELAAACKEQGLALGIYNSSCDWYHPDFPLTSPASGHVQSKIPGGHVEREEYNLDRYIEYLKNLSVELIQNYGPLLVMWYDGPDRISATRGQGVINRIREIQPGILVNNRTRAPGDFDTPEQRVGSFNIDRPWETCMPIARQWAWKPDDEVKSLEQTLHGLIRSAGGDGNMLLSLGPKADGTIEPLQAQRLREMGQWMNEYGYTIYGTRGGPFKPTDWGVSTRKGNKIYLHLLKWFGDTAQIRVPDTGMEITACRLLNDGEITLKKQDEGYLLKFPGKELQPINTIIELTVDGNAMDITPMEIPSQSLSFNKPVKASTNPTPWLFTVNNGNWVDYYWSPAKNDKMPWVEIDLEGTEKVSQAIIFESGKAVKSFEIQCLQGESWKTIYTGTAVENGAPIELPGLTTQKVRLVINEFSSLPGIYEFIIL